MNTAEYLIKRLEELGINNIFGVPGDYNFNILYAINNNSNVKWIGCTNELNAGYAADGYARQNGYGAVVTTYGVGELSAINAIAGASAENVPIVNIVGVPSTKTIDKKKLVHHNFQQVDYYRFSQAFEPVVATIAYLTRDNAKIEIDRALKILVKEKMPIYIAIPSDIATMEISDRDFDYNWQSDEVTLKEVTEKIVSKMANSKKPVILGDVLIKRFDAKIEYKEFVEKSRIPVTNFLMGLDLIDSDYDLYLGTYFSKFLNPVAQKYIEETDCLIAVGTIYSDLNSFGCSLPYNINSHIAINGTSTFVDGKEYKNIKMSDVLECVTKSIQTFNLKIEKPAIGYYTQETESKDLSSNYIYSRIQEYLKENDILIAETGIIPHGVSQIKCPPNINIESQLLWGAIGWATPATLGTCLAKPKSRVILITGEGAHQISALEIGNMLRQGVTPVIIVINNNGYTIERVLSDNPNDSFNDIVQMNYSKFARIFEGDIWSTRVTTEDDFDKALKVTQIMNKLCYIEVCISKTDVPKLTRDVISSFKKQESHENSQIPIQKTVEKVVGKAIETVTPTTQKIDNKNENKNKNKNEQSVNANIGNKIIFETVVHKGIMEK